MTVPFDEGLLIGGTNGLIVVVIAKANQMRARKQSQLVHESPLTSEDLSRLRTEEKGVGRGAIRARKLLTIYNNAGTFPRQERFWSLLALVVLVLCGISILSGVIVMLS